MLEFSFWTVRKQHFFTFYILATKRFDGPFSRLSEGIYEGQYNASYCVPSFLFFFCYLYWDDSTVYPRVTCRKYTKILVFSRIQPSISPLKIYYRLSIFNLTKSLILNFVILRSSPQVLVNFKIDVPDVVMVMSTKIKFIISITPPLYLGFE